MKTIYQCEICDRTHDTVDKANECESGHSVIEIKWWWLIPFVGWFMVPYSLFTKKNAIIKPKNWKERSMLDFVLVGPFLVFILFLVACLQFYK